MSQSLVTYFPRSQGRSWFQIPFPASRQHVAGSVLDLLDGVLSRKAIDGIMGKVTTLVNCSPNSLADCCAKAFLWMVKHSPSCKGCDTSCGSRLWVLSGYREYFAASTEYGTSTMP